MRLPIMQEKTMAVIVILLPWNVTLWYELK